MDGVRRRATDVGRVRPAAYVLTDGGFVGVHVWFDELPPRRHHSLIMSNPTKFLGEMQRIAFRLMLVSKSKKNII